MLNVHKVELATGIIVALVVSFPRKVKPFWMTELVTWRKKSLKNEDVKVGESFYHKQDNMPQSILR